MPTRSVPTLWTDAKQHIVRMAEAVNMLLKGAHNEVYDLEILSNRTMTHFPFEGGNINISGFTNYGSGYVTVTTATAHGLVNGDIAVITNVNSPGQAYQGHYEVFGATTLTFRIYRAYITGTGTTTGKLYKGLLNARITPATVGLIVPADAFAATLWSGYGTTASIYEVASIGHIDFIHPSWTDCTFKLVLFGD